MKSVTKVDSANIAITIVTVMLRGGTFIRSRWQTMWKRYLWSMAITNLNTNEYSSH